MKGNKKTPASKCVSPRKQMAMGKKMPKGYKNGGKVKSC